ncbi:hypothetical protein [Nocardia asiatica]|uniref:hypothetical protein n=1 Tax=Nocardia asiatica TaxID=209252 RepID=UPI0024574762|nr:hypothetical protein [Nocardia asiatica]
MNWNESATSSASATGPAPSHQHTDALRAQLEAAYDLPFGRAREQRITDLVLAIITAEIGRRNPSISTVLLDWAPYGGLGVAGFRDHDGNNIRDHELDLDISFYASDIRAADSNNALTQPPHEQGLFRLDLHDTISAADEREEGNNRDDHTPRR